MTEPYIFQKLTHAGDYKETTTLIYQTDPFIYKDLFGNIDNARKVLGFSFDNPKSVFFKGAIYIVKNSQDEVIGCVLNHDKGFLWDKDELLFDFGKAGVEPPPSFFAVSEYMDKTYNYRKIGGNICNVSVRKDYQRKGVASFLFKNLFELTDQKVFELTLLWDNVPAIKLYEKFGFKIVGDKFEDYGGYKLPPVFCYKMVCNK